MKAATTTRPARSIHWYRVLGCVLVAGPWVIMALCFM